MLAVSSPMALAVIVFHCNFPLTVIIIQLRYMRIDEIPDTVDIYASFLESWPLGVCVLFAFFMIRCY